MVNIEANKIKAAFTNIMKTKPEIIHINATEDTVSLSSTNGELQLTADIPHYGMPIEALVPVKVMKAALKGSMKNKTFALSTSENRAMVTLTSEPDTYTEYHYDKSFDMPDHTDLPLVDYDLTELDTFSAINWHKIKGALPAGDARAVLSNAHVLNEKGRLTIESADGFIMTRITGTIYEEFDENFDFLIPAGAVKAVPKRSDVTLYNPADEYVAIGYDIAHKTRVIAVARKPDVNQNYPPLANIVPDISDATKITIPYKVIKDVTDFSKIANNYDMVEIQPHGLFAKNHNDHAEVASFTTFNVPEDQWFFAGRFLKWATEGYESLTLHLDDNNYRAVVVQDNATSVIMPMLPPRTRSI